MSIQVLPPVPPAGHFLLTKARDDTERKLVESVKQRTKEYLAKWPVEEDEIDALTQRIAYKVFDAEYAPSLEKILPNPTDRNLLIAIYKEKVIIRLIQVSTDIFRSSKA